MMLRRYPNFYKKQAYFSKQQFENLLEEQHGFMLLFFIS